MRFFLTNFPFKVPGVASLGFTSTWGTKFHDFSGFGGLSFENGMNQMVRKRGVSTFSNITRFLKVTVDTHAMACMVGR